MGEHVDYNDGWVLPIAINRAITFEANPIPGDEIRLTASDFGETVRFTNNSLQEKKDATGNPLPSWAHYPAGVAWSLQRHGLAIKGVEARFSSDLPIGAGLSSSAALEVGFAVLWEALGGWKLDRMTLARYCQEAEVDYVGLRCGLMDQFACANGLAGHALFLDTRNYDWRSIKLPAGVCLVIADSKVKHALVNSAYNIRREECLEAVRLIKKNFPEIQALRDVSMAQLRMMKREMPETVYRRARHIVTECERVQQAATMLEVGNSAALGELMFQTHASLRDDYEVSCPALDTLVEIAATLPGCLGARLTGGGFGGSTVNLVKEKDCDGFIRLLAEEYRARTGLNAGIFRCKASDGARVVK
jgi:galactokinase